MPFTMKTASAAVKHRYEREKGSKQLQYESRVANIQQFNDSRDQYLEQQQQCSTNNTRVYAMSTRANERVDYIAENENNEILSAENLNSLLVQVQDFLRTSPTCSDSLQVIIGNDSKSNSMIDAQNYMFNMWCCT